MSETLSLDELLAMIKTIKSYTKPPHRDDDVYALREPWQKFSGVSSGICMKWCWFTDNGILERASPHDIIAAYNEITERQGTV